MLLLQTLKAQEAIRMNYATDQIIILLSNDFVEYPKIMVRCSRYDNELTQLVHEQKPIKLIEAEWDVDSFFTEFEDGRLTFIKFRMAEYFKKSYETIIEDVVFKGIKSTEFHTVKMSPQIETVLRTFLRIGFSEVDWLKVGQHLAERYLEQERVRLENLKQNKED